MATGEPRRAHPVMRKIEGDEQECYGCVKRPATGWDVTDMAWCDKCGKWNMHIGDAVEVLNRGGHVTREGWNGKGMYLYLTKPLQVGDGNVSKPILILVAVDGSHGAWNCTQADLFAKDWMMLNVHREIRWEYQGAEAAQVKWNQIGQGAVEGEAVIEGTATVDGALAPLRVQSHRVISDS